MRALLSVYDKTGIIDLARSLIDLGYELVSTGGTQRALAGAGLPVVAVSEVTGFPEILDGRVKTLHPAIHGGLLARRDLPAHQAALQTHQIVPIDLVVSNLYPFAETVANPGTSLIDALEQIDIGGPAMIRAAAKNFPAVVVLTDPADYGPILAALRDGSIDLPARRQLAAKAFAHVSAYDAVVAAYLAANQELALFPQELTIAGKLTRNLRYGENPQQQAAAYRRLGPPPQPIGLLDATQIHGPELSFNNLLDADAAWSVVHAFAEPTVAVIKHTIPCGLASRSNLTEAFDLALAGDPVSAYGGIVALNEPMDPETAEHIAKTHFDLILAPGYSEAARQRLSRKKKLRLLDLPSAALGPQPVLWDLRPITGGLLVQQPDSAPDDRASWHTVTERQPTAAEWDDLVFAWAAIRYVKSNAIVLVKDRAIVGVGSGQPNRVESVAIAVKKAGERAAGASLASDAFFPFADGLETAAAAGITAVIQPGGSVRDEEVLAAANTADVAMVLTGTRHFRH